jgi:hypothetical protein
MNYSYLLRSAKEISAASEKAVEEYSNKKEVLVAAINKKMETRSDLTLLIGHNNIDMMKDNHANHVRFIHSILKNPNPEVLADTVLWVFRAYKNHGFSGNYWAAQLNAWMEILKKELSTESYEQIYPLYEWMQVNIPSFEKLSESGDLSNLPEH